ncbi:MAG: hypothetical protein DI627_15245 [Acinetobacter sp.]|uniref:DUF7940 domain-containing protein n=1 Tax=Acinetobacter sp. TaxID=472 RepID=UPI000DB63423|nr:hypothetical protein [Acinetobacter sp.]PZT84587.1 MAG: hypothetical protein DI627_15245 [Acinetobacter sp.]
MKETQHKLPRNFVQSPRIDPVIHAQLNSKVDELTLQVAQLAKEKTDQAKRHQVRVTELKDKIEQQAKQLVPMLGVSSYVENHGFLVRNWKTFWKWLSTWAFAAIGYVSFYGVPQEILVLVPEANQSTVTGVLALIGFIGRFINQSRSKPLPPVQGDADV